MFFKAPNTQPIPAQAPKAPPSSGNTVSQPLYSPLSAAEDECKQQIYTALLKILDLSLLDNIDRHEAKSQIQAISMQMMEKQDARFSHKDRLKIIQHIENDIIGLGPLEPLLADPTVSDILVNGTHSIYLERKGKLERCPLRFTTDSHLSNIIDRIVSKVGRRIDESSPLVDARLADGSRVNVIIPPLAIDGAVVSIRRFAVERLSMDNLTELGTVPAFMVPVLEAIIKARLNVVISGGTGSGKTTLLNILSACISESERIITIEDSAELQLQQPHTVRLESRPANVENKGEVTQRDLVRNSLRMRPDRIILGEVRGAEALDMLQAMNTGHDGSLSTVHANAARDALSRIENMVAMTGINFPIKALRSQIASAIHVLIQIQRHEDGKRRLVSIQEVSGMEGEIITMSEIFRFQRQGIDKNGAVIGEFTATGIVPSFYPNLKQYGIDLPIEVFSEEPRKPHE